MDLSKLSIEELQALIEEAKRTIKEKKDNICETNRSILEKVNEGDIVRILFKGSPVNVKFVGLTKERFTVEICGAKKSILLDKLLSVN